MTRRVATLVLVSLLWRAPTLWAQADDAATAEVVQSLTQSRGLFDGVRQEAWDGTRDFFGRVYFDFENQYTGQRLYALGGTLAVAAILANTHADQGFRDWYQDDVRSPALDDLSRVVNFMGDHYLVGAVCMSGWGLGRVTERILEEGPVGSAGAWLGDWGNRSMRGMLVGCISVGILQVGLGASRPDDDHGSGWSPFRDNNSVSGHVFVSAVPFLTAARMTEFRPLKATFFAGSFLTALGRINNDDHYLSQVILGWTIAFLATGSVMDTDAEVPYRWRVVPIDVPDGVGVGIRVRY